ncbi:MAG: hypothetical protein ACJAZP_001540 [Psychromonas sp.]
MSGPSGLGYDDFFILFYSTIKIKLSYGYGIDNGRLFGFFNIGIED